jgi:hypothetical protein
MLVSITGVHPPTLDVGGTVDNGSTVANAPVALQHTVMAIRSRVVLLHTDQRAVVARVPLEHAGDPVNDALLRMPGLRGRLQLPWLQGPLGVTQGPNNASVVVDAFALSVSSQTSLSVNVWAAMLKFANFVWRLVDSSSSVAEN